METARVLTWEGIEMETEREVDRKRKSGDTLYLIRKPEPEKRDHTYTLSEGFTL